MSRRNILVLAGVAVVAVVTVASMFDDVTGPEALTAFSVLALAGAFAALGIWGRSRAWIEAHARAVRWTGIALAVASLPLAVIIGLSLDGAASDLALDGALMTGVAGVLAAFLPDTARRMREARAEADAIRARPAPAPDAPRGFSPWRDGLAAAAAPAEDAGVFLQIAGPWALAISAAAALCQATTGRHAGVLALLGVMALMLGLLVAAVPTVATAWQRWILQGRRPPAGVALPDRAALSWLWRLWVFGMGVGALDNAVVPKIAQAAAGAGLGSAGAWTQGAEAVLGLLALTAAGNYGPALTAKSVGDKGFTTVSSMALIRRLWPAYPVGLVLAVAPYTAAGWALDTLTPEPVWRSLTVEGLGLLTAGLLLTLAGVCAFATYVARAYRSERPAPVTPA